jgi:C4-dicarboxylate transporter DctM subunit
MDPLMFGLGVIGVLLALIGVGIPVAFAMAFVGAIGLAMTSGPVFMLSTVTNLPYAVATEFSFLVIPMFIFMGALTSMAGITNELYTAAYRWTSRLRGSLYYTTIIAAGGFGAINGSTVVSSVLFTKIALPEMNRFGYPTWLSAGCICAAGTFAAMIPPSLSMVLFAVITNESVGALLMAGVAPGLLTVALYIIGTWLMLRIKPHWAPAQTERFTLREKLGSMKGLWALLILIVIVMGGIYTGVLFPSTAGAMGAVGALVIGVMRRRIGFAGVLASAKESISVTAVLFLIIMSGLLMSRLLLGSGFVTEVTQAITEAGIGPMEFLLFVIVLYLILGMFVDAISIMVMTLPFLFPVGKELGIDPIWFGVLVVKLVEIAAISPPVGFNLYAVITASNPKVSARELFKGVAPYLGIELVVLVLLVAFPAISLYLPQTMVR